MSDVQDRQQILLSMGLWLLPTLLVAVSASPWVLVTYSQTLNSIGVNCIRDSCAPLIFVALDLQGRWTVSLSLVQQNGPLDFVDDFLLVQKALVELVFDEVLDFARVDKATRLTLEVVDRVLRMELIEIVVAFLRLAFISCRIYPALS